MRWPRRNSIQRRLIGFGAGRSGVVADMALTHLANGAKKELLTFTAEADSRRHPGALVAAPIGAAFIHFIGSPAGTPCGGGSRARDPGRLQHRAVV